MGWNPFSGWWSVVTPTAAHRVHSTRCWHAAESHFAPRVAAYKAGLVLLARQRYLNRLKPCNCENAASEACNAVRLCWYWVITCG